MRGNLLEHSISTVTPGSPDTFTLARVTGSPMFTDVFGTSGTMYVEYTAIQWTDSTRAQVQLAQGGYGILDLSTNILTQTSIIWAWDPSGPTYDATSPTELTFTAGANTTRVECSPAANTVLGGMPFACTVSPSEDLGLPSAHAATIISGNAATVLDREYYIPHWWQGAKEIIQIGIRVGTLVAAGAAKHAIYEMGSDGLPGRRILDTNSGSPFDGTSTGNKLASVSGLWLPPGWYYDGFIFNNSTLALRGISTPITATPLGTASGLQLAGAFKAGSYATGLPSPASTGLTLISNAAVPAAYWKQAA